MLPLGNTDSDSVDFNIVIEAAQALKSLESLRDSAASVPEIMDAVQRRIQSSADKVGVSFGVMETKFKEVIGSAEALRNALTMSGQESFGVPLLDEVAKVRSPFGAIGDVAGFKGVNDLRREGLALSKQEEQSAVTIAKELNAQAIAEKKKAEARTQSLNAANQELAAIEKEGAILQQQLQTYGQISRTSSEAARYLGSFAGTQQGQSILTKFFGNYQQAQGVIKQIDVLKSSILDLSKATGTTFSQAGKLIQDQFSNLPGIAKQTSTAVGELNSAFDKTGKSSKSAFESAISGVNAFRIALGAVISMLLFQGIQAVTSFFKGAIDQARQFEDTLYRIRNAERQLSEAGSEVTVKGLKEGIDDLQKALPIFSQEDVAELIGGIATTTKELGFSEDQMLKLGAAVAILNVNSTEAETLLQTMGKVVNSVISPQAKSVGNLGLAFGKAKIEAKAFEMQILKTGETFEDLTEKEKTEIKYQIVLDTAGIDGIDSIKELRDLIKNAGGDFSALDDYLKSNSAKLQENSAAWKDLQTTVGQIILPFLPALSEFFHLLNGGFIMIKIAIVELLTVLGTLGLTITAVFTGKISTIEQFTSLVKTSMDTLRETIVNALFKEIPEDSPDWFIKGWGDLIKEEAETATSGVNEFGESIKEIDTSGLSKVEDVFRDTAYAVEDLAEKMVEKLEDLDTEYQRKALDAQTDYLRKVDDINRDYEEERASLLKKHRRDDEKEEAKYQLALWELRMRYLMDLEDALHARDARQVLRLMKQYKLDKETLRRKHELEEKERKETQKTELENLKRQREERLAQAKIEYERKLADLNLAKQREQEDLAAWYMREFEDLKQSQERKLQEIMAGWAKEQEITAENAAQVYAILNSYFGPGGMTDQLYQYMMQSLLSATQGAINNVPILPGQFPNGKPKLSDEPTTENLSDMGANLLRTKTKTMLGDMKLSPLSLQNNFSGSVGRGGAGEISGQARIYVDLSPDLTGRIVEQSLNGVAEIITRINRSKG